MFRRKLRYVAFLGIATLLTNVARAQTDSVAQADTLLPPGVYTKAERLPEFPGGRTALLQYVADKVRYPKALRKKGYNVGPLTVRFVVTAEGDVRDVRVASRPTSPDVAEAVSAYVTDVSRAFEKMPRWQPARIRNQNVAFRYFLPIQVEGQ